MLEQGHGIFQCLICSQIIDSDISRKKHFAMGHLDYVGMFFGHDELKMDMKGHIKDISIPIFHDLKKRKKSYFGLRLPRDPTQLSRILYFFMGYKNEEKTYETILSRISVLCDEDSKTIRRVMKQIILRFDPPREEGKHWKRVIDWDSYPNNTIELVQSLYEKSLLAIAEDLRSLNSQPIFGEEWSYKLKVYFSRVIAELNTVNSEKIPISLKQMTVIQLKAYAKLIGSKTSGNKAEIISNINLHDHTVNLDFHFLENYNVEQLKQQLREIGKKVNGTKKVLINRLEEALIGEAQSLIYDAIKETGNNWTPLTNIGQILSEKGFKPKRYGRKKLGEVVRQCSNIEYKSEGLLAYVRIIST